MRVDNDLETRYRATRTQSNVVARGKGLLEYSSGEKRLKEVCTQGEKHFERGQGGGMSLFRLGVPLRRSLILDSLHQNLNDQKMCRHCTGVCICPPKYDQTRPDQTQSRPSRIAPGPSASASAAAVAPKLLFLPLVMRLAATVRRVGDQTSSRFQGPLLLGPCSWQHCIDSP